jgi:DNA-binding HxlR family transcriptional regulator
MKNGFRCKCPITSALDIIGDKWSLVVIKQMLFEQRSSFKEFSESPEAIASNILTARLKMLEKFKLVEKHKHPTNKKTKLYCLTEKALGLVPMIIELTIWSKHNVEEFNQNLNIDNQLDWVEQNKEEAYQNIKENYRQLKQKLLNL